MEFEDNLKFLREALAMTQKEVGNRSGLHPSAIAHFEAGRRKPSLDNLVRLCKGMRCTPNDLIDIEGKR